MPRNHGRSVEPETVKEWQRRLTGVDAMPPSLSARGPMHGDISAHLSEVDGASVSKQTIRDGRMAGRASGPWRILGGAAAKNLVTDLEDACCWDGA
ncbi:hypothetical protein ACFUNF_09300 [Streptomyces sp. NPDC057291]|uniref:hypothetical protein n=1 Tax=Streptomyces sp. NPDC057291 TaxID=3346087 RepID=UPI00363DBEF5